MSDGLSPRPASLRRFADLAVRFRRADRGATAVEFAILALPFLFLIFAILELAMVFWTTQVLETAVANASRQIYTGQFQSNSTNANKTTAELMASFKTAVCDNVPGLFNCATDLSIDIRNASNFAGVTPPNPVKNGVFDASGYSYESVGPNQIGLVTAAMQYKPLVPLLPAPTSLTNGYRLIMATAVFKTEPYQN